MTKRRNKAASKAMRSARQPSHSIDLFGLERETRIANSPVRQIFTPHEPVRESDFLFGRQNEVRKFVETLNTPGQHALLYGERGVGKSSLCNVVSLMVRLMTNRTLYTKRCDRSDTFETVIQGPLRAIGADLNLQEVTESTGDTRSRGVSNTIELKRERASVVISTYKASGKLSPSSAAEALQDLHGLLVIDEADALSNSEDRIRIAELIKLLGDSSADFKIMVVGIADTSGELTSAHPSVKRNLRDLKLRRMEPAELREIIASGSRALKLFFDDEVTDSIITLSDGYPHFTHLLALKCAEEAVASRRTRVKIEHLTEAMSLAIEDAEGSLRIDYENGIRSTSPMYKSIVCAAAELGSSQFTAVDLRNKIEERTGTPISQPSLSNYFQKLVSVDHSTILHRTGQGHYRFEDPRMASYIRIVNQMI